MLDSKIGRVLGYTKGFILAYRTSIFDRGPEVELTRTGPLTGYPLPFRVTHHWCLSTLEDPICLFDCVFVYITYDSISMYVPGRTLSYSLLSSSEVSSPLSYHGNSAQNFLPTLKFFSLFRRPRV